MHDDVDQTIILHIRSLRRFAIALVGNTADADELVQESLTRTIERVRAVGPCEIANLHAYLFRTLRNLWSKQLARRRSAGPVVQLEDAPIELAAPPCQPHRVEAGDLIASLDRLPHGQREVILLVALEGVSYQEAADILCVPVGTVMSRLYRGRETLRQAMSGTTVDKERSVE